MFPLLAKAKNWIAGHKLSQDIVYTLGSFLILALSGIIINIAITALRDASALGVFNLSYAVYIVASQFAAWGLHYSVMRHTSFHEHEEEERSRIFYTACACTIVSGFASTAVMLAAEPLFAILFKSGQTAAAVSNAALGLALFPLNKVLLAYLNGLRHMKAYAIFQGMRYIAIMSWVIAAAFSTGGIERASLCFIVAEGLTAALCCLYIKKTGIAGHTKFCGAWVRKHYAFGSHALVAGMFTEVNARIDVLMLGMLTTPYATGIYSFAAMLADGLYQILSVLRLNFNPLLVSSLRENNWDTIRSLRKQAGKFIPPVIAVLTFCLILAYACAALWIIPGKNLMEGMPSLLTLAFTVTVISCLVPFDNMMLLSGHAGYQAIQQLVAAIVNVAIALALIPVFGIEGAAIGTAASYVSGIAVLVFLSRRILGWSILKNALLEER